MGERFAPAHAVRVIDPDEGDAYFFGHGLLFYWQEG
jgi:hypothetical protein